MSFFRSDRAFSPFFRHDPFTPFFPRSSFHSPLSFNRVFDTPSYYSPFSPFITAVYEEPRSRYEDTTQSSRSSQSSAQISNNAAEVSPSQSSDPTPKSNPSQSQDVTRTEHNGGRRHHQHHSRPSSQQQMSLWSPFTGSLFPSSFINSAFAPLTPLTTAVRALPEITLDMFSTPQAYSLQASVPGMEKKDIKVTVEDGVLTIQAERKESNSRAPSRKAVSTSSSPSPSIQGATSQGSPSSSTTGAASDSQLSAEMKYPTEEKEEKVAPPTTRDSSADPATAGAKDVNGPSSSSSVSTSESSNNAMDVGEDDDDEGVDFHHVESFYGRVERSVQLPEDAKVEDLTARYENGILKIEIPRVQEQKIRGRRIEIQ